MANALELVYAEATDTGVVRPENQDAVFAGSIGVLNGTPVHLLLIADGMGGYQSGDVASRLAATNFRQKLLAWKQTWPAFDHSIGWQQLLKDIVIEVNALIIDAQVETSMRDMGTTLTAAVECDRQLHIAHVGDSRFYHYNGEDIAQISQDHSLVGELMRMGQLTAEEARVHPRRNVITQALGVAWDIHVQTVSLELLPESKFLLCSDGLSNMVTDDELRNVLESGTDPYVQVRKLVDWANERGGTDNISVIIAAYHGEGGDADDRNDSP